jgi:hypothetical protein
MGGSGSIYSSHNSNMCNPYNILLSLNVQGKQSPDLNSSANSVSSMRCLPSVTTYLQSLLPEILFITTTLNILISNIIMFVTSSSKGQLQWITLSLHTSLPTPSQRSSPPSSTIVLSGSWVLCAMIKRFFSEYAGSNEVRESHITTLFYRAGIYKRFFLCPQFFPMYILTPFLKDVWCVRLLIWVSWDLATLPHTHIVLLVCISNTIIMIHIVLHCLKPDHTKNLTICRYANI